MDPEFLSLVFQKARGVELSFSTLDPTLICGYFTALAKHSRELQHLRIHWQTSSSSEQENVLRKALSEHKSLRALRSLVIPDSQDPSKILEVIGDFRSLIALSFQSTPFYVKPPRSDHSAWDGKMLSSLRELSLIRLTSNKIGTILSKFSQGHSLAVLQLGGELNGETIKLIGSNFSNIEELVLSTDQFPAIEEKHVTALWACKNLTALEIQNIKFSTYDSELDKLLDSWPNLRKLSLLGRPINLLYHKGYLATTPSGFRLDILEKIAESQRYLIELRISIAYFHTNNVQHHPQKQFSSLTSLTFKNSFSNYDYLTLSADTGALYIASLLQPFSRIDIETEYGLLADEFWSTRLDYDMYICNHSLFCDKLEEEIHQWRQRSRR
jgi:hypothetical protein